MKDNLLIITQKVDEEDDLLGFFVGWIRNFADNFEKVYIITLANGNYNLPENVFVYSLGKERDNSKISRFFNFYKYLFKLIPQSTGVFAHMSPIFVIASWPVAFIFRKKIVLWYLHRSVTFRLKVAEKLCYKIVTADKGSIKFKSKKILETGHGINVEKFKTERSWDKSGRLKILSVGRISPIKNYETLIGAAGILREEKSDFEIKIIGRPVMPGDQNYLDKLKEMTNRLKVGDIINFAGFMLYSRISEEYKAADLVVGMTPQGGIDKAILEAMASGALVLTSNDTMKKYLGDYGNNLIFNYGDKEDLADKIKQLIHLSAEVKSNISDVLCRAVKDNHNIKHTIAKISQILKA